MVVGGVFTLFSLFRQCSKDYKSAWRQIVAGLKAHHEWKKSVARARIKQAKAAATAARENGRCHHSHYWKAYWFSKYRRGFDQRWCESGSWHYHFHRRHARCFSSSRMFRQYGGHHRRMMMRTPFFWHQNMNLACRQPASYHSISLTRIPQATRAGISSLARDWQSEYRRKNETLSLKRLYSRCAMRPTTMAVDSFSGISERLYRLQQLQKQTRSFSVCSAASMPSVISVPSAQSLDYGLISRIASQVESTGQHRLLTIEEPSQIYVEFDMTPDFTLPSQLDLTEDAVNQIATDIETHRRELDAKMADIKRLSELGELPVSVERNKVRVHFPNSDMDQVYTLLADYEVTRGVVVDESRINSTESASSSAYSASSSSASASASSSSEAYTNERSSSSISYNSDVYGMNSGDFGVMSFSSEDIATPPSLTRGSSGSSRDISEAISQRM